MIHSVNIPPEGLTGKIYQKKELVYQHYVFIIIRRLGLGAKFLSHAEAMRHNNDGGLASKEEILLKNKILNQNRRAATHREAPTPIGKRFRPQDQKSDSSDDDDDEGSRSSTVGTKQQPKKKAKAAAAAPQAQAPFNVNNNNKKKIGNQGDFLSMYLSERAGKKKNRK
jgi:hypothetical protein